MLQRIRLLIVKIRGDCSQRVVDLAHLVANKWPGVAAAKGGGDPLEEFYETNPADEECKVFE